MAKTGADSAWDDEFEDDDAVEAALQDAAEDDDDDDDIAITNNRHTLNSSHIDDDEDDEDDEDENEDDEDDEDEEANESSSSISDEKPMRKSKMTSKSAGHPRRLTKAEAIREIIAERQAAGKNLRPKEIIETLRSKGIEVNASQVSITLRAMGVPAMRRGGPATSKDGTAERVRQLPKLRAAIDSAADGHGASRAQLIDAAIEFANIAGGYDEAKELLVTCQRMAERKRD